VRVLLVRGSSSDGTDASRGGSRSDAAVPSTLLQVDPSTILGRRRWTAEFVPKEEQLATGGDLGQARRLAWSASGITVVTKAAEEPRSTLRAQRHTIARIHARKNPRCDGLSAL
jgi:hypothetical protein